MMVSKTAITVEKAAKAINKKKIVPQILPLFMELKTFGRVIKIRPGPESGLMLKAKHAGKIISPAKMATTVSRPATQKASPVSDFSLV